MRSHHFDQLSKHLQGVIIVSTGVFFLSFDALLIRLANTAGWNVIFWRGGLIALSLLGVLWIIEGRNTLNKMLPCLTGLGLVCTVIFGANNVLFVQSVSLTSVSNTLVILASGPLFAAVFSRIILKETIQPRTWIAILVSICGVTVVFAGSLRSINIYGDLLALATALVQGINFTLLRRLHDLSRIAMIGLSGLVSMLFALFAATPFSLQGESYLFLGIMGLMQMPVALVLISMGTRYLKAPEVTLFLMIETFLGPLLVWLFLAEAIPLNTFIGGGLILTTLFAHTYLSMRAAPQSSAG
jgi:drug/metabolite transporter (DMT)-like permease